MNLQEAYHAIEADPEKVYELVQLGELVLPTEAEEYLMDVMEKSERMLYKKAQDGH